MDPDPLHPAEHRAFRELHARLRQLASHWSGLAGRVGGEPASVLADGEAAAKAIARDLVELGDALGVPLRRAAAGAGAALATGRNLADLSLERNQALRLAVDDAQQVATLLAYLAALADVGGAPPRAATLRGWEARMRALEERIRATAVASASDPDAAIAPVDTSPAARALHGAALLTGTVGEWVDGRLAGRGAPGDAS